MKNMKWIFAFLTFYLSLSLKAQVQNTSYINSSNEKVLQFSMVVPLDIKEAWKYFSTDAKLAEWIAPVAHIELKNGGYIITNYDKTKALSDNSSIKLGIISYLENELLILKVELNNNFSKKVQDEDQQLQEIIQLVAIARAKQKLFLQWPDGDKEKIGKKPTTFL